VKQRATYLFVAWCNKGGYVRRMFKPIILFNNIKSKKEEEDIT